MARISRLDIYDYDTLPTFDDYVIGTDPENSNRTKNYRIADIVGLVDGSATRFTTLFDTPSTYVGQAGKVAVVNGTEDGLVFDDVAAPDLSGYVTLANYQIITGFKSMTGGLALEGSGAAIEMADLVNAPDSGIGSLSFNQNGQFRVRAKGLNEFFTDVIFDTTSLNGIRTYTLQNSDGTLAHLSDIPDTSSFVQLFGNQSITGVKTFNGNTIMRSLEFQETNSHIPRGVALIPAFGFVFTDGADTQPFSFKGDNLTALSEQTIQNKSGTIAHLDDLPTISQGSFTATLSDVGGGATYSIFSQVSNYYRVGKMVTFSLRLSGISTSGTPSGILTLGGLPFNMNTGVQNVFPVNIEDASGVSWYSIHAFSRNATGKELSFKIQNALDPNHSNTFVTGMGFSGGDINITGTYWTDDA